MSVLKLKINDTDIFNITNFRVSLDSIGEVRFECTSNELSSKIFKQLRQFTASETKRVDDLPEITSLCCCNEDETEIYFLDEDNVYTYQTAYISYPTESNPNPGPAEGTSDVNITFTMKKEPVEIS